MKQNNTKNEVNGLISYMKAFVLLVLAINDIIEDKQEVKQEVIKPNRLKLSWYRLYNPKDAFSSIKLCIGYNSLYYI